MYAYIMGSVSQVQFSYPFDYKLFVTHLTFLEQIKQKNKTKIQDRKMPSFRKNL